MIRAITYVKGTSVSIITTIDDLLKELNHYRAFWLSSVGSVYSSKVTPVEVKVEGLTEEDRRWLSARMR